MVDSTLDSALQHSKGERMAKEMDPRSQRAGAGPRILIRKAAVLGAGASRPLARTSDRSSCPERPLRIAIGLAGIGLAGFLMAQ